MAGKHLPDSPNYSRQELRTGATLGEAAKIFRDAFCIEYIKDFNGRHALARLGYTNANTLSTKSSQLLLEPYVRIRIDELVRQLKPEDVVTRQQVMARMWTEANNRYNDGATRVTALAHIAKMLGMFKDKEESNTAPIGVMMIPCYTAHDWQTSAVTAQAVLKRTAGGALECPPPQPVHGQS